MENWWEHPGYSTNICVSRISLWPQSYPQKYQTKKYRSIQKFSLRSRINVTSWCQRQKYYEYCQHLFSPTILPGTQFLWLYYQKIYELVGSGGDGGMIDLKHFHCHCHSRCYCEFVSFSLAVVSQTARWLICNEDFSVRFLFLVSLFDVAHSTRSLDQKYYGWIPPWNFHLHYCWYLPPGFELQRH